MARAPDWSVVEVSILSRCSTALEAMRVLRKAGFRRTYGSVSKKMHLVRRGTRA